MLWNTLPPEPHNTDVCSVIQRMIAGLGFRYYWATENLRDEDWSFKASSDSMSIFEVSEHLYGLTGFISTMFNCRCENADYASPDELRKNTLDMLTHCFETIGCMNDESIQEHKKFWLAFNGPLADALTHVGQICTWRRINCNPIAKINYLTGQE